MADPKIEEALASGRVPPHIRAAELERNHDVAGIASISVVTALTLIIVLCRLASRRFVTKRFGLGLDDGVVLVSLVTFILLSSLYLVLIKMGAGRTFPYISFVLGETAQERMEMVDSVAHLVYNTTLWLCRLSGLAFYYRICELHKEFIVAIRVILGVITAGYLAQMGFIIFHCKPVTLLWVSYDQFGNPLDGSCLAWWVVYGAGSGISLFSDLLLFGLPLAMLKVLDMPRKRKFQLACILLPGLAVIGISSARVALVVAYGFEDHRHFQFAFLKLLVIEVSEASSTLIALSIPGVKPMVDKFILRKDLYADTEGSRFLSNRGSIGSSSSSIRGLKEFARYGTEEHV
ncbi:hypothetical protein HIM_11853 [Hirsutella minnesotensis 3608]|uniref:Rhodopsin domain-containing protein n=1 Tax=Hirsutella minnesotensis 3608 TaxID=1043627 RepID=A0A0F7ZIP3_9HYPO|nr:hypothetical protein HIM_11853 [Hirsutella minnesotensis 3608]